MMGERLNSQRGGGEILLIGDAGRALISPAEAEEQGIRVHTDILDGIEAGSEGKFAVIAVVMSKRAGNLKIRLRALRAANKGAKIVLLCQMYDEPLAREIVAQRDNGRGIADDYLICPVSVEAISDYAHGGAERGGELAGGRGIEARMRELERLATEDALTGLKNRRYLWEFGRQIIDYAGENKAQVTLLMFDIDNFKHYNDNYGHRAGDEVLVQTAQLIKHSCRSHDVVGRIGGDEFAVIFWDEPQQRRGTDNKRGRRTTRADHPREVRLIAKRFIEELKKTVFPSLGAEGRGVLTISGGLASFPRDGETIDKLLEQADKGLREAKGSGKNRIYLVGKSERGTNPVRHAICPFTI